MLEGGVPIFEGRTFFRPEIVLARSVVAHERSELVEIEEDFPEFRAE